MKRSGLIAIAGALLVCGIAAAIAGCLPYDRLQSFGALVRRADDFTAERFERYRHVCWFFAVVGAGLAVALWQRSRSDHRAPHSTLAVSHPPPGGAVSRDRLLWLIVAVGVVLRLQRLCDPVAYDEAYTYLNFASRPWYEAIGDYNSTNNHLLNTLLMHVSTRIFGPQEWALRWHVMLAGCVLPIAVCAWGKEWLGRGVGLIAAAAVAVSPMLITYSTDARGYMLVTLAAIVFDLSLGRLARDPAPLDPLEPRGLSPRTSGAQTSHWWLAWAALVIGLCSMPLMVYAAVGSAAWFLIAPLADDGGHRVVSRRARTIAGLGLLAVPAVAAFYAPAYVFRGLMFLRDPVVQPAPDRSYLVELGTAWNQAYAWWTGGQVLRWLCGPLAVIGLVFLPSNASRLRWCLPFVVVLLLNIVQHVAPPPRIYMHLAPWLFIAAASGLGAIAMQLRRTATFKGIAPTVILLSAGGLWDYRQPVLFNVDERMNFRWVRDAIAWVQADSQTEPGRRTILLAPLPCDLPSIFYLRRSGGELPVNLRPQPGERVYLLARPDQRPEQVLRSPLLNMDDLNPQFDEWRSVMGYPYLELYTSQIPPPK